MSQCCACPAEARFACAAQPVASTIPCRRPVCERHAALRNGRRFCPRHAAPPRREPTIAELAIRRDGARGHRPQRKGRQPTPVARTLERIAKTQERERLRQPRARDLERDTPRSASNGTERRFYPAPRIERRPLSSPACSLRSARGGFAVALRARDAEAFRPDPK